MLDLPNAFDDARVFWLVSAVEHNVHTRIVFNAEILSDDFFPASSSLAFTRKQAFLFTVFFVVLLDEFIGKANKVVFSPLPPKQQGSFYSSLVDAFDEKPIVPDVILIVGEGR